jgi:hypothetical protein
MPFAMVTPTELVSVLSGRVATGDQQPVMVHPTAGGQKTKRKRKTNVQHDLLDVVFTEGMYSYKNVVLLSQLKNLFHKQFRL